MILIIRLAIALVTIGLAAYALITNNFQVMPYTLLLLGILLAFSGFEKMKSSQTSFGMIYVAIAAFTLFIGIYTL